MPILREPRKINSKGTPKVEQKKKSDSEDRHLAMASTGRQKIENRLQRHDQALAGRMKPPKSMIIGRHRSPNQKGAEEKNKCSKDAVATKSAVSRPKLPFPQYGCIYNTNATTR